MPTFILRRGAEAFVTLVVLTIVALVMSQLPAMQDSLRGSRYY